MLILNRKPGQSIQIAAGGVGPHTPIGEVFAAGPIEITVSAIANKQVKVGVAAHPGLTILRSELAHRTPTRPASPPEPQPAPAPGSALANTNDTPNTNSDATPIESPSELHYGLHFRISCGAPLSTTSLTLRSPEPTRRFWSPTPISNHTRQTLARKLTVLRVMHKLTRQHLAHLSQVPESTSHRISFGASSWTY